MSGQAKCDASLLAAEAIYRDAHLNEPELVRRRILELLREGASAEAQKVIADILDNETSPGVYAEFCVPKGAKRRNYYARMTRGRAICEAMLTGHSYSDAVSIAQKDETVRALGTVTEKEMRRAFVAVLRYRPHIRRRLEERGALDPRTIRALDRAAGDDSAED